MGRQGREAQARVWLSLTALACCVVLGAVANGFQGDETKKDAVRGQPLIIALRGKAKLTEGQMHDYFEQALKHGQSSASFRWKTPTPNPKRITKTTYDAIKGIIENLEAAGNEDPRSRVALQTENQTEFWEISVGGDKERFLESVVVTFDEKDVADKDKPRQQSYALNKIVDGVKLAPRPGRRGVYGLHGDLKGTPKQYTLVLSTSERVGPEPWPAERHSYWLVKLEGWEGDAGKLFGVLGDEGTFANPVVVNPRLATIGVGSFVTDADEATDGVDGNKYVFRVPSIPKASNPADDARVWMLFPLTREEATKASKELAGKGAFKLISDVIAKGKRVAASDEKAVLSPEDQGQPRWFELALPAGRVGQFERTVPVQKVAEWRKEPVYRIVVWEVRKRKTGDPQAVTVKSGEDEVNHRIQEVTEWPRGLRRIAEEEKKKGRKDD